MERWIVKVILTFWNRKSERFGKKEKEIALDASRHITGIIFQEQKKRKFTRYQVSLNRR